MPSGSNLEVLWERIKKFEEFVERNPDSPLLVRLASLYLEIGEVDKALTLCNRTVQRYPDYATAHLLLARCYIELKAYSKALFELNKVAEILPDSKFVIDLIARISLKQERGIERKGVEKVELPEIEFPESFESVEGKDMNLDVSVEDDIFELPEVERPVKEVETQADYLEELIKKLETEKPKRPSSGGEIPAGEVKVKEDELSYDQIEMVTPALAEILVKQGAYDEAIKVYKKLIQKRPYEKERFEAEIKKLEGKIASKGKDAQAD